MAETLIMVVQRDESGDRVELPVDIRLLQRLRGMRVAAHAAPVFESCDPIDGNRLFYGSGVTKTARIEPRTPEGEVYVTHAFATLAVLGADDDFECSYVGTLQAAKGYGPVSLYSLRSRHAT